MKPLAITGVGLISPVALGWQEMVSAFGDPTAARERAFGGESSALSKDKFPLARVAEVRGFDPVDFLGAKGHRNFDRLTKFLIAAGKVALQDAGLKADGNFITAIGPERVGICSSTAYGSLDAITELNLVAELEDPRYINPARFPNTVINSSAGYVSIWEDLRAPNVTIVDGNCGALDAVLACETHLSHRRADAFLVGGGDILSDPLYLAFQRLGTIAEGKAPCVPGDADSEGTHLGEGAAYLVVERHADAVERGAKIRAMLAGYGTAFEAPIDDAFLLNASPVAVNRAIRLALDDAGIQPEDVDAVCASCSGLARYDAAELYALEQIFGTDKAIAAPKSMWGECFAATGALGMAAAVAWIDGGARPGPIIAGEQRETTRTVLVMAVGYYGNVSAVVIKCAA